MSRDPEPLAACLCTALRTAANAATRRYDAAMAPLGLKITMFRLLRVLARLGTPTITEFAQAVSLDRSTLGRNVKVLERMGLVAISDGPDERSRCLSLTDQGRTVLKRGDPLWAQAQREMRDLLGDDATTLLSLLTRLDSTTSSGNGDRPQ